MASHRNKHHCHSRQVTHQINHVKLLGSKSKRLPLTEQLCLLPFTSAHVLAGDLHTRTLRHLLNLRIMCQNKVATTGLLEMPL
jgi:hypothetical protein